MLLIIHRGTHQIGGSCLELQTAQARVIIDLGLPLADSSGQPLDSYALQHSSLKELRAIGLLPDVQGLYRDGAKGIDAVFISHAHQDHYGLLNYIHPDIPIYVSTGAKPMIEASTIFTRLKVTRPLKTFRTSGDCLRFKGLSITPYLMDHSGFDSCGFLVEAEHKRLFYSGDFRGHGRKNRVFDAFIAKPPKNVDCLVMEGTSMGRHPKEDKYPNEEAVQSRLHDILKARKDITFIFCSPQNVDRLVSTFKAIRDTDRILVIDLYTAFILDSLKIQGWSKLPGAGFRNVRVYHILNQINALKRHGQGWILDKYKEDRRIGKAGLKKLRRRIVMVSRYNRDFKTLLGHLGGGAGAKVIYSMWPGYIKEELLNFIRTEGMELEQVHTSGHAPQQDLLRLAKALKPRVIIPIHTEAPKGFEGIFDNVLVLKDGQSFNLNPL